MRGVSRERRGLEGRKWRWRGDGWIDKGSVGGRISFVIAIDRVDSRVDLAFVG